MVHQEAKEICLKISTTSDEDFKPFILANQFLQKLCTKDENMKNVFKQGQDFKIKINQNLEIDVIIDEVNESENNTQEYFFLDSKLPQVYFVFDDQELINEENTKLKIKEDLKNQQVIEEIPYVINSSLSEKRKDIKLVLDSIDKDIHVGVVSTVNRAGKGSLINTLYRSYSEKYRESLAFVSMTSTKPLVYTFPKKSEKKSLFFKEIPLISEKKDIEYYNLKDLDVVLYIVPSDLYIQTPDVFKEGYKLFSSVHSIIVIYTKIDTIKNNKLGEKISDQVFEIESYNSRIHQFGDDEIDEKSLDILSKIAYSAYNKQQKELTSVTIGKFFK